MNIAHTSLIAEEMTVPSAPLFLYVSARKRGAFRGPQGFSPPVQLGGIPDCLLVIFVPNSDGRKLLVARGMHGPGQSIAHLRFS
jgi:hypothetical protein